MEKTKLGVSAALLSMLCYFTGYANLTACVILFAVILAFSDSLTAKKNATQALVMSVLFSVVTIVLGWISGSYMSLAGTLSGWFYNWFEWENTYEVMSKFDIMGLLVRIINFVELLIMVVFVIKSLKGKVINIPVVSKLVNKHFSDSEE